MKTTNDSTKEKTLDTNNKKDDLPNMTLSIIVSILLVILFILVVFVLSPRFSL